MNSKRILVLGSTGSIGTQALEVIADNPDKFELVGIAAGGSDPALVIEQARKFNLSADRIAVARADAAAVVSGELGAAVRTGADAAAAIVRDIPADTVLNALVGSMGIHATMATIEAGGRLGFANKKALLSGGTLVV